MCSPHPFLCTSWKKYFFLFSLLLLLCGDWWNFFLKMGVYIFKFLGETGDEITWCKVGWTKSNPWRRLKRGFNSIKLPVPEMRGPRMKDARYFELLHWWPDLTLRDERLIHRRFERNAHSLGEWYAEHIADYIARYVNANQLFHPNYGLSHPRRSPSPAHPGIQIYHSPRSPSYVGIRPDGTVGRGHHEWRGGVTCHGVFVQNFTNW